MLISCTINVRSTTSLVDIQIRFQIQNLDQIPVLIVSFAFISTVHFSKCNKHFSDNMDDFLRIHGHSHWSHTYWSCYHTLDCLNWPWIFQKSILSPPNILVHQRKCKEYLQNISVVSRLKMLNKKSSFLCSFLEWY